jgi:3'-phosphoadenosine 5'-phosphosulfate sulfotransferase (PAPS reductase)/FAD synthetase
MIGIWPHEPETAAASLTCLQPLLPQKVADSIALLREAVQTGRVVFQQPRRRFRLLTTIWEHAPQIDIFTVDTGRLPEQTLELLERIERRYKRRIRVVYPQAQAVQNYVADNGINGFYHSLAQRQSCCAIRKIEPFRRAVLGYNAWITGVRHEQSEARASTKAVEWDERYRMQR